MQSAARRRESVLRHASTIAGRTLTGAPLRLLGAVAGLVLATGCTRSPAPVQTTPSVQDAAAAAEGAAREQVAAAGTQSKPGAASLPRQGGGPGGRAALALPRLEQAADTTPGASPAAPPPGWMREDLFPLAKVLDHKRIAQGQGFTEMIRVELPDAVTPDKCADFVTQEVGKHLTLSREERANRVEMKGSSNGGRVNIVCGLGDNGKNVAFYSWTV